MSLVSHSRTTTTEHRWLGLVVWFVLFFLFFLRSRSWLAPTASLSCPAVSFNTKKKGNFKVCVCVSLYVKLKCVESYVREFVCLCECVDVRRERGVLVHCTLIMRKTCVCSPFFLVVGSSEYICVYLTVNEGGGVIQLGLMKPWMMKYKSWW